MKIEKVSQILKAGGVGVLPTDTIYGLVGSALQPSAIARVYRLKNRRRGKPSIILIGRLSDLALFRIKATKAQKNFLATVWPGRVSVILPAEPRPLAFRLPRPRWLRKLLEEAGPLIAPSANPADQAPARNIAEAKKYFGTKVDFYLVGRVNRRASKLVDLTKKSPTTLRT